MIPYRNGHPGVFFFEDAYGRDRQGRASNSTETLYLNSKREFQTLFFSALMWLSRAIT
jgi:hypothetical protein